MQITATRVTVHMVASVDGYIARPDGRVDWMETADEFAQGETMDAGSIETFLASIDCYVMGSKTYETAVAFESKGLGWAYGEKPVYVLTHRVLGKTRSTVEFFNGDVAELLNGKLRNKFRSIWIVGGGKLCGECVRLGLVDEIRYSILPVLIGNGISFFDNLATDVALHLVEVKGYKNGMVALRYEVRKKER